MPKPLRHHPTSKPTDQYTLPAIRASHSDRLTLLNVSSSTSFLSLPGELRNQIYKIYASEHVPRALYVVHGQIECVEPPLSRVSRQIRQEVASLDFECAVNASRAESLTAVVTDFDFGALADLFERLQGRRDKCSSRIVFELDVIEIKLVFTKTTLRMSDKERTRRPYSRDRWEVYTGFIWLHLWPEIRYSAEFDPPDLEFEKSELCQVLRDETDIRRFGSVPGALRAAFQEKAQYLMRQHQIEELKAQLENLEQTKARRSSRKGKREVETQESNAVAIQLPAASL